jgi:hypothetical protein
MTHRQAAAQQTGWKGGALKPGTRTVQRPVLWRSGHEAPSPGTRGHDTRTAAGEKIIRLEVVCRISSAFHKPALIREVLYGFSSLPPCNVWLHVLDNESTTFRDIFIILKHEASSLKLCVQVQNLLLIVLYYLASTLEMPAPCWFWFTIQGVCKETLLLFAFSWNQE